MTIDRAGLRKLAAGVCLCAGLTGCSSQPIAPVQSDAPDATPSMEVRVTSDVYKFCDGARLVYVFAGYKSGGLALVESAPECARQALSASDQGVERE